MLVLGLGLLGGVEKNLAATSLFPGPDYVIPGGPPRKLAFTPDLRALTISQEQSGSGRCC